MRFPFTKKFQNFGNGGKWYGKFLGKFPETPKTIKFPKCESFNGTFQKFWSENLNLTEIPGKKISTIWVHITGLPSFLKIPEITVPFATGYFRK